MMRSNPKKKHNISGKWHIRACLLIVAMLLTVAAAGCSKEPSEQAGEPTGTPEPTNATGLTGTPEPTKVTEPAWMSDSSALFIPSGIGGRVTFTGTTAEISGAEVGDTVQFGSYEQDNDAGNGAEAIEWLVLDKQDGKLLLLSKDALDTKPYDEEGEDVTWETCTLRRWLNSTFYNTAFSEEEQGNIVTTKVKNEDNPKYDVEGGNDTKDKVFLLSIGEALGYFDPDPDAEDSARRAKITEYADEQGGWSFDRYGAWWLRSQGGGIYDAVYVGCLGDFSYLGTVMDTDNYVVRPALWLDPEA